MQAPPVSRWTNGLDNPVFLLLGTRSADTVMSGALAPAVSIRFRRTALRRDRGPVLERENPPKRPGQSSLRGMGDTCPGVEISAIAHISTSDEVQCEGVVPTELLAARRKKEVTCPPNEYSRASRVLQ
jgi:hypothetical protein